MIRACLVLLLAIAAASPVHACRTTVFLAGDSTMAPKLDTKRPESGWGEYLEAQFVAGTVAVDNRARNGRSTRTFIELGEWQSLLDAVNPGDVVLIQFGHNDQSENKPDRYTPVADYVANLRRFVDDVRARKATPVLLTPVARRNFDAQGRLVAGHGDYPAAVRTLAAREKVALVDMEQLSSVVVSEAGVEGSKALYLWQAPGQHVNYPQGIQDNTHFSPEGARRMAEAFAGSLRGTDLPLAERVR